MIVDAHVHLMTDTTGWYAYKKSAGGSDARAWDDSATVRLLDDSGIDRCWLFTLAGLYGFNDWRAANDQVMEAARLHPDRFVPFCTAFQIRNRMAPPPRSGAVWMPDARA
jgi:hypothetical protein